MNVNPTASSPLRIMPLGDSITAGYTDNPVWEHPFEFGYRSGLYQRLKKQGFPFQFVGGSGEPWNQKFGDPTRGGSIVPPLDLRTRGQDGHRGYGGAKIPDIQQQLSGWMIEDRPDLVLLMIGINGISADSPGQLVWLLKTLYEADPNAGVIVAQIPPMNRFNPDVTAYNTFVRKRLEPPFHEKEFAISTVDLHTLFLKDPADPESIDAACFSNGVNHPVNAVYDTMAEHWFQAIQTFMSNQEIIRS